MPNRNMPVGVDDFKEVCENYYMVDKTDFIRQLIDGHSKVTLITRPRRFGKTLTMSMLDYFFSIEKQDETQHLFDGLAIGRAGEEYMAHRGMYPTIFLTLRNTKKSDFPGFVRRLGDIMQMLYANHREALYGSDKLTELDKKYFDSVNSDTRDADTLEMSILRLTEFLYKAYGRKVILLLDEYDVPIQHSWECGYYKEGIAFMKNFLGNALKGNPYLDFAVITGVLRVGKESIFSDLNNLDVCSVLSNIYSDVFGFTYAEVEKMTKDLGCPNQLPIIKSWYDGYHFGGHEMYNPWSVINFFRHENQPKPYWGNTSSNGLLQEILPEAREKRLQEMKTLLQQGTVWTPVNERIVYSDVRQDDLALYTLLLTTGYLTVVDETQDDEEPIYELRIPNKEVRSLYASEILNRIASGVGRKDFANMRRSMVTGQTKEFEYELQQILCGMVSVYDTANKESFYHGLMLGLVAMLYGGSYKVDSNRESGYGRFDIALTPRDKAHPGVIMEFKVAETPEGMEARAQEALQQIDKKAYATDLINAGVKNIWRYGISFCGKQVHIARS